MMTCRCEFDSGHGWTVIANRFDGSVDFYQGWEGYYWGFGNQESEYFIGKFSPLRCVGAQLEPFTIGMKYRVTNLISSSFWSE